MRNQEEERTHKKKKKVSKFRYYFLNILLGVIIFLILLVMAIYFLFHINTVSVTGNTLYTAEEMEAYVLNDKYSNNGVYVLVKNLIKPRKDIPFVESVQIKITGRNSIELAVTEKTLLGYLMLSDGTYAYFDDDGNVLEVSDKLIEGVTQVNGLSCENAKKGNTLEVDESTLKVLLALIKSLQKYQILVSAITFEADHTMNLQWGNIVIDLGNSDNLTEKVMRLPYVLPNLEGMAGTLHLENWSENQTDIVFKKVSQ